MYECPKPIHRPCPGVLAVMVAWLLASCATQERPDFERLYRQETPAALPPVILLHGILGARLSESSTGIERWFGSVRKLVFSDYAELALDIDPETLEPLPSDLSPSGLADRVAGQDFYGNILSTLETAGGYQRAEPGQPRKSGDRVYYIFVYDWRQDNALTARKLTALIEQIQVDFGNPDQKVDLVAHSMGGLISRYFLRYGSRDVLDDNEFPVNFEGAGSVRRAILLGTPNLGSASSLHAFIEGVKIGLRRIPTEVLATMPSIYQLFPHSLNDWLVTADGRPLDRDIFDVNIWRRFQWSIFNPEVRSRIIESMPSTAEGEAKLETLERYFEKRLERARRFVWSLTVPLPEDRVSLIVFGGDCQLTPARLLVEEVDGVSEIRLWPNEVSRRAAGVDHDMLMLEPGDGTVTKASLLARDVLDPSVIRHRYIDFPLDYALFLCERHDRLTGNLTFQDNLLHVLLSRELER